MKNFLSRTNGTNFFGDIFDDFFKPTFYTGRREMRTDIKESDKGYDLSIDMAGFDKADIKLSLDKGYLLVEANRAEKEEDDNKYVRRERNFSCSRSYYVGENISEEDVKAKYVNGTLNLFVPKKDAKELPSRHIEIE